SGPSDDGVARNGAFRSATSIASRCRVVRHARATSAWHGAQASEPTYALALGDGADAVFSASERQPPSSPARQSTTTVPVDLGRGARTARTLPARIRKNT